MGEVLTAGGRASLTPFPEETLSTGEVDEEPEAAVKTAVSAGADAWTVRGSGRLAVQSEIERRCRRGPRSRTTPIKMVACAGIRSRRSVKSWADRIGCPSSSKYRRRPETGLRGRRTRQDFAENGSFVREQRLTRLKGWASAVQFPPMSRSSVVDLAAMASTSPGLQPNTQIGAIDTSSRS